MTKTTLFAIVCAALLAACSSAPMSGTTTGSAASSSGYASPSDTAAMGNVGAMRSRGATTGDAI